MLTLTHGYNKLSFLVQSLPAQIMIMVMGDRAVLT